MTKVLEYLKEALKILRLDDDYNYNVAISIKDAIKELEDLNCNGCEYKEKKDNLKMKKLGKKK